LRIHHKRQSGEVTICRLKDVVANEEWWSMLKTELATCIRLGGMGLTVAIS
jgi:hypothetical protein